MYQFHFFQFAKDAPRKSVIHGVTLDSYPLRRFSVWLDESGTLIDAESFAQRSAGPSHFVRKGQKQWQMLAREALAIWKLETSRN